MPKKTVDTDKVPHVAAAVQAMTEVMDRTHADLRAEIADVNAKLECAKNCELMLAEGLDGLKADIQAVTPKLEDIKRITDAFVCDALNAVADTVDLQSIEIEALRTELSAQHDILNDALGDGDLAEVEILARLGAVNATVSAIVGNIAELERVHEDHRGVALRCLDGAEARCRDLEKRIAVLEEAYVIGRCISGILFLITWVAFIWHVF